MTEMVWSLIGSKGIADTHQGATLTTLRLFAGSIQSRRIVAMTESIVWNVNGCAITSFQEPITAWMQRRSGTIENFSDSV